MAAVQMYPQVLRAAQRLVGGAVAIPATASRKWEILSDIAPADLADPTLWVLLQIDVEDATQPGGWRDSGGGRVIFQCGPYTQKDGTVLPAGRNRGFQTDAADLASKNVRMVCECRTIPAGTTNVAALSGWQGFPFRATTIGCTREAVG